MKDTEKEVSFSRAEGDLLLSLRSKKPQQTRAMLTPGWKSRVLRQEQKPG